ncbi:MmgE/PrpD family protein [Natrialba swarupiae]|uniref:MmgE/PrpD family protein n=1 Tax=Natrialba swarupiae TaxID=2448032 RepID=A0A5D5AU98_9EURY|nr:MmgE/PrpD family protein [Natrialba swarupiae]TYT62631.1 MmgE/PrpD family protein [Natrialba swarupiae]
MDETEALATFISDCAIDDLPEEVRERARTTIRDTLGVALYASTEPFGDQITEYISDTAPGEEATILGGETASASGAAFANGAFAHAQDYDDTFESVIIHPSASTLPATLAAAEKVNATGEEVLTGYAVGVETTFRIGHAVYPSHYTHGFHSTGTVGSFGATAGVASVLGLSDVEIRRAFGIVASCSSSLLANAGTMTKALHAGHAARTGLDAALLARNGITSNESILSGERGYGEVMTPGNSYDSSSITDDLGETWAIMDLGIKPYPCGRITHTAIEAMRELVETESLTPEDIECIHVTLEKAAEDLMTYDRPSTPEEGRASIEMGLVATLRDGDVRPEQFSYDFLQESETQELFDRIERDFEPNLFGDGFANYGAQLRVQTISGEEYQIERSHAPGSPSNPLSEERLRTKFYECASPSVPEPLVDDLYDVAGAIDEPGNVGRFLEIASGVPSTTS